MDPVNQMCSEQEDPELLKLCICHCEYYGCPTPDGAQSGSTHTGREPNLRAHRTMHIVHGLMTHSELRSRSHLQAERAVGLLICLWPSPVNQCWKQAVNLWKPAVRFHDRGRSAEPKGERRSVPFYDCGVLGYTEWYRPHGDAASVRSVDMATQGIETDHFVLVAAQVATYQTSPSHCMMAAIKSYILDSATLAQTEPKWSRVSRHEKEEFEDWYRSAYQVWPFPLVTLTWQGTSSGRHGWGLSTGRTGK